MSNHVRRSLFSLKRLFQLTFFIEFYVQGATLSTQRKNLAESRQKVRDNSKFYDNQHCGLRGYAGPGMAATTKASSYLEFPWHVKVEAVSLPQKYSHLGSGTLLNREWVLTATVLLFVQSVEDMAAQILVTLRQHNKYVRHVVSKIVRHPDASYKHLVLLKLQNRIFLNKEAWPICLPRGFTFDTSLVQTGEVAGYGQNKSMDLYKVDTLIINGSSTDGRIISITPHDPKSKEEKGSGLYQILSGQYQLSGVFDVGYFNSEYNILTFIPLMPYVKWILESIKVKVLN